MASDWRSEALELSFVLPKFLGGTRALSLQNAANVAERAYTAGRAEGRKQGRVEAFTEAERIASFGSTKYASVAVELGELAMNEQDK